MRANNQKVKKFRFPEFLKFFDVQSNPMQDAYHPLVDICHSAQGVCPTSPRMQTSLEAAPTWCRPPWKQTLPLEAYPPGGGSPSPVMWPVMHAGKPTCPPPPHPMNRMIDRCKNITLTLASGNYVFHLMCMKFPNFRHKPCFKPIRWLYESPTKNSLILDHITEF